MLQFHNRSGSCPSLKQGKSRNFCIISVTFDLSSTFCKLLFVIMVPPPLLRKKAYKRGTSNDSLSHPVIQPCKCQNSQRHVALPSPPQVNQY